MSTSREADAMLTQLAQMKRRALEEQLALIGASFPEVVADAEAWLVLFFGMPWEAVILSSADDRAPLRDKYDIRFHGRWHDDVTPLTALFYETCTLLYERELLDREAWEAREAEGAAPRSAPGDE